MQITFLGVNSALSRGYNSNIVIKNGKDCMLFDCGEDIMYSLRSAGREPEELTSVYISHLHYDHMGGLSWLGYYSYFVMKKRLTLYIHESMISDLWAMLRPAMDKIEGREMVTLDEYFVIRPFTDKLPCTVGSFYFHPIKQVHVETPHGNMYSYGISLRRSLREGKHWKHIPIDNKSVYISSDTKFPNIPSNRYNYIFCDCDTMNLGGVHPDYELLKGLDADTKARMWLYHYHDLGKDMPDAEADGFAGFVKQGRTFKI